MKHLSSIVLAAAVVAVGTLACFSDPTSSARKGPSRILLTRSAVYLAVGDSIQVQAEVKDLQGNTYDAGDAAWTTANSAVAVVNPDVTQPVPYNAASRAYIVAKGVGQTFVFLESHGLRDSVSVHGM